MAPKPHDPKPFQTPSPGAYEKQKADKIIHCSPQYSFGLRTENKIKSVAPAPGTYDIEKADEYLECDPSYSFGLRPEIKQKSIAPAPGTYSPEKADKVLGIRTKNEKIRTNTN